MAKLEPLFVEVDFSQCCKHGQHICGDAFYSQKIAEGNRVLSVLSDGLGSGVKANILASMTAKMALRFAASELDFLHSAEIMMDALPVCQVRKISYATFSIVDCKMYGETRIIEMDNPGFILVRNGEAIAPPCREMASPRWQERKLRFSRVQMQPEDRIVLFSDGISQAGLGTKEFPLGWREEGCRELVLKQVRREPQISARHLSRNVLQEALRKENSYHARDDMTCGVLYFRHPRRLLLLTGPPYAQARDSEYAQMLDDFEGRRVICGGTTAKIIARELKRPIEMDLDTCSDDLPPISHMGGVDLITEGILTLTRTAQLIEQGLRAPEYNAATRLVDLLRESDIIQFVVGSRINEAHQDPNLPLDIEIRRNIIKRIATVLEEKYLKEVSVMCI